MLAKYYVTTTGTGLEPPVGAADRGAGRAAVRLEIHEAPMQWSSERTSTRALSGRAGLNVPDEGTLCIVHYESHMVPGLHASPRLMIRSSSAS